MAAVEASKHRVAAIYLWLGFVGLVIGGVLALAIRWQWAYPGQAIPVVGRFWFSHNQGVLTAHDYAGLFSSHGLVMIFFAMTPILLGGLGHYCVVSWLDLPHLAFPRLAWLSLGFFCTALLLAILAVFWPNSPPASGWTQYPPLSTGPSSPGLGPTLIAFALIAVGISTLLGAINIVVTCLGWLMMRTGSRRTFWDWPLTIWGFFLTSILNLMFVPAVGLATVLLIFDRLQGAHFFTRANSVSAHADPLLYQHLFWLFGHPEVYVLALPIWGVVGDLFARHSGQRPFWQRGTVFAMVSVAAMSGLVYGHHMFQGGLTVAWRTTFEITTLLISAPATLMVVTWFFTLAKGRPTFSLPMLFSLGVLLVFGIGGLTGIPLGGVTTNLPLHDTLWVVGHFHLIMAASALMGVFAALYQVLPAWFGFRLQYRLGVVHFFLTLLFSLLTFGCLLWAGYQGQPRRLFDPYAYQFVAPNLSLNRWTSLFALLLAASQLLFLVNLVWSWPQRERQAKTIPKDVFDPSLNYRFAAWLWIGVSITTYGFCLIAAQRMKDSGEPELAEMLQRGVWFLHLLQTALVLLFFVVGVVLHRRAALVNSTWRLVVGFAVGVTLLLTQLGCHADDLSDDVLGGQTISGQELTRGRIVYERHCQTCHGVKGDGQGPSGVYLVPTPRDFRKAIFKFAGVLDRGLAADSELLRIIRFGLAGTAMQAWDLPEGDEVAVVQYVKWLSAAGEGYRNPKLKVKLPEIPTEPVNLPTLIAEGERLYHSMFQCSSCHPAYVSDERIRGWDSEPRAVRPEASVPKWAATFQQILLPPDFKLDELRSVRKNHELSDLFRVIAYGLQGPMPGYRHLGEHEVWAVSAYVHSLSLPPSQ